MTEGHLRIPPLLNSTHALTHIPQGGTYSTAQSACLLQTSAWRKRVAEDARMRSGVLFPKGSVPGLKHQWDCDLLPLLHACICSAPHPVSFRTACQNISVSLLLYYLLLSRLFHFISFELCTRSSNPIISYIIQ